MPQDEGQMPSEDEDFDVTSGSLENDNETTVTVQDKPAEAEPAEQIEPAVEETTYEPEKSESGQAVEVIQPLSSSDPEITEAPDPNGEPVITSSVTPEPAVKPDVDPVFSRPIDGISMGTRPSLRPTPPVVPEAEAKPAPVATTPTPKLSDTSVKQKRRSAALHLFLEGLLLIFVVCLGLWAWSLRSDNADLTRQVANLNANPQAATQRQTEALVSTVGKLTSLPTNETPVVVPVSNASADKKQSVFFANAQNGDKVLLYVSNGKAVLYRPSTNRVILVSPLTLTPTPVTPTTTTKTTTTTTK